MATGNIFPQPCFHLSMFDVTDHCGIFDWRKPPQWVFENWRLKSVVFNLFLCKWDSSKCFHWQMLVSWNLCCPFISTTFTAKLPEIYFQMCKHFSRHNTEMKAKNWNPIFWVELPWAISPPKSWLSCEFCPKLGSVFVILIWYVLECSKLFQVR